jgi:hypothetical protein
MGHASQGVGHYPAKSNKVGNRECWYRPAVWMCSLGNTIDFARTDGAGDPSASQCIVFSIAGNERRKKVGAYRTRFARRLIRWRSRAFTVSDATKARKSQVEMDGEQDARVLGHGLGSARRTQELEQTLGQSGAPETCIKLLRLTRKNSDTLE